MGLAAMSCPRPQPPIKKIKKPSRGQQHPRLSCQAGLRWSACALRPEILPPLLTSCLCHPPPLCLPLMSRTLQARQEQGHAQPPPLPPVRDHPLPGTRGSLQHQWSPHRRSRVRGRTSGLCQPAESCPTPTEQGRGNTHFIDQLKTQTNRLV